MRIDRARLTAALVAAGLALSACQDAQAQVKLEYKYKPGKKLTYKTSSKTSQTLTLMGQALETGSSETVVSSRTVGAKRGDATTPVEEKIEALTAEISLPGGNAVSYDSKNPDAAIDNPQLAFLGEVFRLMSGITYTVVLDEKNQVKAIEGTEKILEKTDKLSEAAKQTIKSRVATERLKQSFEQSHGMLPEILVRTGEPWEKTEVVDIGNGQTLTFQRKYEYLGTEKKGETTLDKIGVKTVDVKYAMDPNVPTPLRATKSDLKVDGGDSTILFDREGGYIVSTKGKTHITGKMTFQAGGQEIPGELDLTMENDTELQPAK